MMGGGVIVGGRSDFLAFFYRPRLDWEGWPDLIVDMRLEVSLLMGSSGKFAHYQIFEENK